MTYIAASADSAILDSWRTSLGQSAAMIETRNFDLLADCVASLRPRLVLLDLRLLRSSRAKAIVELRKLHSQMAIVAFVENTNDEQELALLRAGVRGVCRLDLSGEALVKVVASVSKGEVWVRRALVAKLLETLSTDPHETADHPLSELGVLTPREIEIVQLIGTGSSNKKIAQRLAITERTVKGHLTTIFRKTGTVDRVKLALLIARRHRLALLPSRTIF
jgi:DNA-binding NarL/FixJ family response regulator